MSSAIPIMSLSFESVMEALLLGTQTLVTMLCLWHFVSTCSTPLPPDSDNGTKELNNLLVPPRYVLRVGVSTVLCFLLNDTTGEDNELYLAALVTNISTSFWWFFKLLDWRYLAIIAFGCMWCGSLPIYLASTPKSPLNPRLRFDTFRDSIVFFNEQISLRLFFTWLTGALIFGLLDVAQYIYGSIFSYNIYAGVMVGMLVLALVTYRYTEDLVVMFMAIWFLGQIISREDSFEGDDSAKETLEKLVQVANIMWFVFLLMMMIDWVLDAKANARVETQVHSLRRMNISSEDEESGYGTV